MLIFPYVHLGKTVWETLKVKLLKKTLRKLRYLERAMTAYNYGLDAL